MISIFRRMFNTRRPQISVRSRVNLLGTLGLIERSDGVVESMVGDEAYVEWANGARSVESARRLVRISA